QRRVEAQALAGPPATGEDTDDAVAPLRAVVLDAAARTRASLDGRTG
ncbi:carboxylate--amine ligase, partial [Micrococcus luteus]|nr:carboxylate--amine ligase [Micrococcus luteus]